VVGKQSQQNGTAMLTSQQIEQLIRATRLRSAWGSGYFLLHDGRTTDLVQAIQAPQSHGEPSTVEQHFDNLSPSQQQDLLNFLRPL